MWDPLYQMVRVVNHEALQGTRMHPSLWAKKPWKMNPQAPQKKEKIICLCNEKMRKDITRINVHITKMEVKKVTHLKPDKFNHIVISKLMEEGSKKERSYYMLHLPWERTLPHIKCLNEKKIKRKKNFKKEWDNVTQIKELQMWKKQKTKAINTIPNFKLQVSNSGFKVDDNFCLSKVTKENKNLGNNIGRVNIYLSLKIY